MSSKKLNEDEHQKSENIETTLTNESLNKEVDATTPSNENNISAECSELLNPIDPNFQVNGKLFLFKNHYMGEKSYIIMQTASEYVIQGCIFQISMS